MTSVVLAPRRDIEPVGSTVPRLFTPPRWSGSPGPCGCGCALRPATSWGFEAITFAREVLGVVLLPWQRWWLIHILELATDPDPVSGRRGLRHRTTLTLVARQQGKSFLLRVLALWALYVRGVPMVLGAAQSLDIARETWLAAVELARGARDTAAEIPALGGVRYANGEQCLTLAGGQRYKITAATRGAGRGLTVDVLLLDELREHRDYAAWAALTKTTLARPNALIVAMSNAGDDGSVVLNDLRTRALDAADRCRTGSVLDPREPHGGPAVVAASPVPTGRAGSDPDPAGGLFLAEWSAPEGCALNDVSGWAAAMPSLNVVTVGPDGTRYPAPMTTAAVAAALGTDPPAVFRTELLCQRVGSLHTAFDAVAWAGCAQQGFSLAAARDRVAVCVDVARDGEHVTVCGAVALPDERVGVTVLGAWEGKRATARAERALPEMLAAIMPIEIGWFAGSPVGSLGPVLRTLRRTTRRTRPTVVDGRKVLDDEHVTARLSATMEREAAQGFGELIRAGRVVHPADPLLDAQVTTVQRMDGRAAEAGWRLTRLGGGHCDAAYAAAGAAWLARTTPVPAPRTQRARIY